MSGLGPVVGVLWKELGLAPPVGPIGATYAFELGEMPVELAVMDDGETVILRGQIGQLEGNAHEAGDQLARTLRLGLAMAALNEAVLDASQAVEVLERDHEGLVPVYAVAKASLLAPKSIVPALRAVLDWQSATESILTQGPLDEGAATSRGADRQEPEVDLIIFQP